MLASPFIWGVTAKLVVPPDQSSYYNDRLSGTMFVRCPGHVWFLKWIGHVTWAGVRFVKESVYRKGRWVYETIAPLSLDIRRLVAWGIDLLLLWLANGCGGWRKGEKGLSRTQARGTSFSWSSPRSFCGSCLPMDSALVKPCSMCASSMHMANLPVCGPRSRARRCPARSGSCSSWSLPNGRCFPEQTGLKSCCGWH